MSKEAAVHTRIESSLKKKAELILKKVGLSPSQAIVLFYNQITLKNGIPFPVNIPNEVTEETFRKTDRNEELSTYSSFEEMLQDLKLKEKKRYRVYKKAAKRSLSRMHFAKK